MSRIKRYFITGLLVVVPLYITVYVFIVLVKMMDNVFNVLPGFLRPHSYLPLHIPGLGIFFTIFGIFVVGVLAQNLAGKKLAELLDRFLARIPFLRIVYNATKQFMETFLNKGHHGFEKVVVFEFPRKGVYAMGFVTGSTSGELREKTADGTISIFLPTTPNPTSGYYVMVPEKELIPLDMRIEDAFKVIMTGGIVVPDYRVPGAPAPAPVAERPPGPKKIS